MSGAAGFRASNAVHFGEEGGHVFCFESRANHLPDIKSDEGHPSKMALNGNEEKNSQLFSFSKKNDESCAKIEQNKETSQK